MDQCRQGKSAKWIRNFGKRIGSEGLARGSQSRIHLLSAGYLTALAMRVDAACGLGDGLGTAHLGAFPGRQTTDSELVQSRGIRLFN
ncbi:hypothetical protein MA16_Dca022655 [Dendrobium catenatum]|uniref:Uncharacterized protein n=1 Tax=Dendrobium catenatum TaxID=906689 RepID=A0A2I0VC56_9ASPA|nr:hypothetical protein MA16_Dca022655 [Dendrobium catenatum]